MATYPHQGPAPYARYEGAPRPLGEVIRDLPRQYMQVLTRPSAATFAAELGKAEWRSVWFQLLGWGFISAIVGFIAWLISPITLNVLSVLPGLRPEAIQGFVPRTFYGGQLVSVPLNFFIWMGLLYLMAKAFNGQGTFLEQSYATVLFQAPLAVLSSILTAIPFLSWISFAIFIYGIVLQVFAIMAVHHLSGGKATTVVFLPGLVIALFITVFAFVFAGALIGALLS
jgi:hypothetical protein